MDYRTGLPGPGPGAHELRGPLSQSLCVKSLLCVSYLRLYFVNLLLALIECTCTVYVCVCVCAPGAQLQTMQPARRVRRQRKPCLSTFLRHMTVRVLLV